MKSSETVTEFEPRGAAVEEMRGVTSPLASTLARIREIQESIERNKKENPKDESSSGKPLALPGRVASFLLCKSAELSVMV